MTDRSHFTCACGETVEGDAVVDPTFVTRVEQHKMSHVALAFESKAPHTTPWLVIEHPVDEAPTALLETLEAIGWKSDGLPGVPPLDGIEETKLRKVGTDLFGGWNESEKRANMTQVRTTLRKHGFTRVPWTKLSWHDLI